MTPFGLERGKHQVHPTVTVNLLLERGQSEPCRDSKLTMHGNPNMKYELEKWKQKNIVKYQRFTRLNVTKREKLGRMKPTGEPDAVEWFSKKVCLVWRTIFHFAIYVVFEKLAVSSVIDNNRERDVRRYMMLINSLYQSAESRIVQAHTIFLARER